MAVPDLLFPDLARAGFVSVNPAEYQGKKKIKQRAVKH